METKPKNRKEKKNKQKEKTIKKGRNIDPRLSLSLSLCLSPLTLPSTTWLNSQILMFIQNFTSTTLDSWLSMDSCVKYIYYSEDHCNTTLKISYGLHLPTGCTDESDAHWANRSFFAWRRVPQLLEPGIRRLEEQRRKRFQSWAWRSWSRNRMISGQNAIF